MKPMKEEKVYRLLVVPAIALILLLTTVPIIFTFVLSFQTLNLARPMLNGFVGFKNYLKLFSDERFINSIRVTASLIALPVFLQMVIGFILALLLAQKVKGRQFAKAILLAPMVSPPVVIGLLWKVFLIPKLGGLNYFLSLVRIQGPDWLSYPGTALMAIVMAAVWEWTPFVMLMFSAGFDTLPSQIFEAARVDGAVWYQQLWFITLPLLRPLALTILIFRILEALAIFPIIYVLTGGGPGVATEPINLYAFNTGFVYLRLGYAATLVVVFTFILFVFSGFFVKVALGCTTRY